MTNLVLLTPTPKERFIAGVSHLFVLIPFVGFLAPRIIWATQKDKSQYVASQSFQAFMYQVITLAIWLIGMALFSVLPIFGIWFIPFLNLIVRFILAMYGIFGAIMAFQGKAFRYFIISTQLEHWFQRMQYVQAPAKFIAIRKHPFFPFLMGFGVACIHFVIAEKVYSPNISTGEEYFFSVFLLTPSLILDLPLSFAPIASDFFSSLNPETLRKFSVIIFSSFVYGVLGAIIASKNIFIQTIGIILVFLMILSFCYLGMMIAMVFG